MLGLGQMGSEGLLSVEAVCELTGFSRATLYRRLRAGLFPPRVWAASLRRYGWRREDVDKWVALRDQLQVKPGRRRLDAVRQETPWPAQRQR